MWQTVLALSVPFVLPRLVSLQRLNKAGDSLNSRIISLEWRGVKRTSLFFSLVTSHTNSVNRAILIDLIDLSIAIDNSEFARIQRDRRAELQAPGANIDEVNRSFTIKARGVTPIQFPLEVNLLQLLPIIGKNVTQFIKERELPKEVTVRGKMVVEGFTQEYNQVIPLLKKE